MIKMIDMNGLQRAMKNKYPVKVIYTYCRKTCVEYGIITALTNWLFVSINGLEIPFIGLGRAIRSISTNNTILYAAKLPFDYCLRNLEEIHQMRIEFFGQTIAEKLQAQEEEAKQAAEKKYEEFLAMDRATKTTTMELIEAGHKFIAEERQKEWTDFIINYSSGEYRGFFFSTVAQAAIAIMKALTDGQTIEEATEAGKVKGISPYRLEWAMAIVAEFHGRGEEAEAYRQKCLVIKPSFAFKQRGKKDKD